MQSTSRNKIPELQSIISKMPLDTCCSTVLPEFGVKWRELSRVVRNARLPMTPMSVARVLCKHVAKDIPAEEIDEMVARLRLKLITTKRRTWHVIRLSEQVYDEPVNVLTREIPSRVLQALKTHKARGVMRPEVQSIKIDNLIYISVQMSSNAKGGTALYIATPPGEPVALVSSLHSSLLKACILGLGYEKYEDATLCGQNVQSLLRIINSNDNKQPDFLTEMPQCSMVPSIARNGVSYMFKSSIEETARRALGASPPKLERLAITSEMDFFDRNRLNKKMKVTLLLRSEDISETLVSWAVRGAIHPDAELFQLMHDIKSNKICYTHE